MWGYLWEVEVGEEEEQHEAGEEEPAVYEAGTPVLVRYHQQGWTVDTTGHPQPLVSLKGNISVADFILSLPNTDPIL